MPIQPSGGGKAPPRIAIFDRAAQSGLDTTLLYQTILDMAGEGLVTAGCLNAAAAILLSDLGLPKYFFCNLSRAALEQVLRAIATNLQWKDGQFVLRGAVSEMPIDVDSDARILIATAGNRDQIEGLIDKVMAENRVEYYFGSGHGYYTYIVRPERCPRLEDGGAGGSCFAFTQLSPDDPVTPLRTRERYEGFLERCRKQVEPLVEVSPSEATPESRIMFRDDFRLSPLPVIRQIVAEAELILNRAYWETFRASTGRVSSICSLYLASPASGEALGRVQGQLQALLSIQTGELDQLFIGGGFSFAEYLFASALAPMTHALIHKDLGIDRDAIGALSRPELKEALAARIFDSDRAEYTRKLVFETVRRQPALIRELFGIFDARFNPKHNEAPLLGADLERRLEALRHRAAVAFVEDRSGRDVLVFMTRLVAAILKTNFFKLPRRSCAFRLDPAILDPLVFTEPVYGMFFVAGFYASGTHMRAEDVARGGVRLVRVTPENYENELDAMPLLNYALGPVAQRLKHKDIAESGAKGVIVPGVGYAQDGLNAVLDLTEGIGDLTRPDSGIRDFLGRAERIFYGPDEGTAPFMDIIAARARERGDPHWRTATTGKKSGIPHDTYGLMADGRVFGLTGRGAMGTELELEGEESVITVDMEQIHARIGGGIASSGMTTTGVTASFREVLKELNLCEADLNLMMTGGPDGDLGANQIQSFAGRICLLIDGGSVLFDPEGLDRRELMKLAFARHTAPRLNSLAYPLDRLSARGFRIPRSRGAFQLPGGKMVDDGFYFHRSFLTNPQARDLIQEAGIRAFIPCGGAKDAINGGNVGRFLGLFRELRVIVEGANLFFDDKARQVIAEESAILQIRDSTANKGGVTSSSLAEVLPAFLLGENYEKVLVENRQTRLALIRSVFELVIRNAVAETRMLLELRRQTGIPLYRLSRVTSERLLDLQKQLCAKLDGLLARPGVVEAALQAYVPSALLAGMGLPQIVEVLQSPELVAYRNAMITKKIAALALYRFAGEWEQVLERFEADLIGTVGEILSLS